VLPHVLGCGYSESGRSLSRGRPWAAVSAGSRAATACPMRSGAGPRHLIRARWPRMRGGVPMWSSCPRRRAAPGLSSDLVPQRAWHVFGTLRPEQGTLGYVSSVRARLRRSATSGRPNRPHLNAPDGRLPLPFRSQNRTAETRCIPGRASPAEAGRVGTGTQSGVGPVSRFRGLRTAIHYRPRVYLTWAERQSAFAGERLRKGVNETRTETTPRRPAWHAAWLLGGAGERRGDLVGTEPGPGPERAAARRPRGARDELPELLPSPTRFHRCSVRRAGICAHGPNAQGHQNAGSSMNPPAGSGACDHGSSWPPCDGAIDRLDLVTLTGALRRDGPASSTVRFSP
jgi:hypothetical protein